MDALSILEWLTVGLVAALVVLIVLVCLLTTVDLGSGTTQAVDKAGGHRHE